MERGPLRGEHEIRVRLRWRLDGDGEDPAAPLVLCLHGMGMDEDGFALLLQGLLDLPVRLLVPRGPYPVEVRREGRIGASWYAYDGDQDRFRAELERAESIVLDVLRAAESAASLKPRARYLLGFSQGGYLGAFLALRHPETFAGMIISGARVKTEFLEEEMPAAARAGFAALLLHGERDASVAPEAARRGRDALQAAGVDAELVAVDTGHSLGRAQIEQIRDWLGRRT